MTAHTHGRGEVQRPECERAHSFAVMVCDSPGCRLHIISFRKDDSPICETVLGEDAVHALLELVEEEGLDI